ncbi:hypothetical protein TIFTF001_009272 [Ficus carica]|uniref:Uncharacterized protein n=1 Tax=Ficus carica TaxID=3494 RepID=A0AA87ZV01_FICCA|nr:hypothetical protein TIFTF001_009272 [Ficus carica]
MGSCISKCRPKKSTFSKEEEYGQFNHVQDKLVILSKPTPTIKIPLNPNKISPPSLSPPSPSADSTSSASSFTCSSTNTATSMISSCTLSSSASSKENYRSTSFSNEFLWSCYKENPHIVRISSIKESSTRRTNHNSTSTTTSTSTNSHIKPIVSTPTQVIISSSLPQKRVRSSSPITTSSTLTRQKSFRRDPPPDQKTIRDKCRTLRSSSPSPSRRFVNGDLMNLQKESQRYSKRYNNYSSSSSTTRLIRPCLRSTSSIREQCRNTHRIGSKIDEVSVAEALADQHEIDSVLMEDMDNPLISLDCFIFL